MNSFRSLFVLLALVHSLLLRTAQRSTAGALATHMPAMSTPLKALIQERLRAKIVRRGDEDFDYEGDMYPPSSGRAQVPPPAAMHGSYALAECKDRSLSMQPASMSSSVSSVVAASVSSKAGFPPHLHTEIDPAAYIPNGQPMSARGYNPHHPGDLSPSPTYGRLDHRQHQSYYNHHDDVPMYHDSRRAYSGQSRLDIPAGLEMLASPRWDEPPRDLLRMNNPSPPPLARGHFHRQSSGEMRAWRWPEKSSAAVHHRSERRHYADDGDSGNNKHGDHSPMREFRRERKRERRQEFASGSHVDHRMRDTGNESNQLWHDVPMSASKFSSKRHMDDRDGVGYSVRPAERASSFASQLAPSEHYIAAKHSSGHRLHRHHRHRNQQLDEDVTDESMTSLMFLPPPDARKRPVEVQQPPQFSKDVRSAPAPLDLSAIASSQRKARSFDQILSPDSRLAANVSRPARYEPAG